ncbi:MAG: aminotransferase class I/II-fold pyridoxal phosphate-dependent enzyme [Bacillota bacterium]|nr:aminotransferase class I/II-fold pyridoxal phosphate-dependent enzyme [Bacillota bacterium]MDW7677383.1 aminotransferase class I/II-fold pyridoxal phosphate-dependent enzyme [Bacillota bacterium]
MKYRIRKALQDFDPVSYGQEIQEDKKGHSGHFIDCSLGTNPFGHSPLIQANEDSWQSVRFSDYPESYDDLKRMILAHWQDTVSLDMDNLVLTAGAINGLSLINQVFIEDGSRVLGCGPQFPEYATDVRRHDGSYTAVSLGEGESLRFSPENLLRQMDRRYTLVHLDHPNNPTGQVIPLDAIRDIAAAAQSQDSCLVVDEAYGDFMDPVESAVSLLKEFENLIILRSFSKGMGLAGLRVGYVLASAPVCRYLGKISFPFAINVVAYQAAQAALQDLRFIQESKAKIRKRKEAIRHACSRLQMLETDDRVPILVLAHPDSRFRLQEAFLNQGVLTVSGECFDNLAPRHVRLRVPQEIDRLLQAIRRIEQE